MTCIFRTGEGNTLTQQMAWLPMLKTSIYVQY